MAIGSIWIGRLEDHVEEDTVDVKDGAAGHVEKKRGERLGDGFADGGNHLDHSDVRG